jgi:hypothetical protein
LPVVVACMLCSDANFCRHIGIVIISLNK